jgi:hypothetical protein
VLCEVYAKLLAMVVQHWLLLSAGPLLGRRVVTAARRVRRQALRVAWALGVSRRLRQVLHRLQRQLQDGCKTTKRRGQPTTFQKLLDPDHDYFTCEKP